MEGSRFIPCLYSAKLIPVSHSRQTKASIRENPGNRFTAPQLGHFSPATSSEASISSKMVRISAARTVRRIAAHSLQTIST